MASFAKDSLEGKSILITGGLGAIGRVVVAQLLSHSAFVVVNDILPEDEAHAILQDAKWSTDRALHVPADVTRLEAAQTVVALTVAAFRRIDVALCHAGMGHSCPIIDYSEPD